MRKPFLALLLLVGAVAMATNVAFAVSDDNVGDAGIKKMLNTKAERSAATRLGASGITGDTVMVAQSYQDHTADNYWNLWSGTWRPGDPSTAATHVAWNFENEGSLTFRSRGDSLNGWWPMRRNYTSTQGQTISDALRPWFLPDFGNQTNYVMISGPAGNKRTVGVIGAWHADPGSAVGLGVRWSPLAGNRSAWCGLRRPDDNTVVDQVTGNAYNGRTFDFNNIQTGPTLTQNKNFPGYVGQWDQLIYRDVQVNRNTAYPLSFLFTTALSLGKDTANNTRTGWFYADPLSTTATLPDGRGNVVSSTAQGANAPVDSFMVYVGVPVNDAACRYSDNVVRPVYDTQRRWFSEVIKLFGAGNTYQQLVSVAGGDTAAAAQSYSGTIPASLINSILDGTSVGATTGNMRIVFRVKTNRGFDDMSAPATFTSGTRGAAIIDNVVFNGVTIGDFEGNEGGAGGTNVNAPVNNSTSVSALNNWKSTGKPPETYWHVGNLPPNGTLRWDNLCGDPGSPTSSCNMVGACLSIGNKSDGEKMLDYRFNAGRELDDGIISPTINLKTPASGVNNMGLTTADVTATDSYDIYYDIYTYGFDAPKTGQLWQLGIQSYPTTSASGAVGWSNIAVPTSVYFDNPGCFTYPEAVRTQMAFNGTTPPDSIRIYLRRVSLTVTLGATAPGGNEGCYFDNVVFGFADLPVALGTSAVADVGNINADIWDLYSDAFPTNEALSPTSTGFDTTSAMIGTGLNTSPLTGNSDRFSVPGDTMIAVASGTDVRVDLVFRILPGPGNYQIAAGRSFPPTFSQALLQSPRNQASTVSSGDASFWGQYLQDPGAFGTAHSGGKWDFLAWNSARCDTSEVNIFPAQIAGGGTGLTQGEYASMYHESDPKFATLGVLKNRCFIADTTLPVLSNASQNNVICNGTAPAYLSVIPQSRTGWDGTVQTREFTKIIPDRLLTPGSHVQYFFRKSAESAPLAEFVMVPDTTKITPQNGEGSTDGHRWQQFGVLPDRYKDSPFGLGRACILYIDWNDRRGNERQWVSVMDSIGGTSAQRRGGHNGWAATGAQDITDPAAGVDPTIAVQKNMQAGSVWDMYGVKASESLTTGTSAIGARDLPAAPIGYMAGRQTLLPPTVTMAASLYRVLAVLTGDLNAGILGPYVNRGTKDVAWFESYMNFGVGDGITRGVFVQGDGFVEASTNQGGTQASLMANKFGVVLRNGAYRQVSQNTNDCVDLVTTNVITTNGDIYGIDDECTYGNDTYNIAATAAGNNSVAANFYEPAGVSGPYIASVKHNSTVAEPYISLVDGWDARHLVGRYCESDLGRLAYYRNMLVNVFGTLCGANFLGSSVDVPGNTPSHYVNFMKVGNSVMNRTANANVLFGVSKADRVQVRVYDVSGRLVRTLADRDFQAGNHSLVWDGTDDSGSQVARGVYFTQLRYVNSNFTSAQKLTVLK